MTVTWMEFLTTLGLALAGALVFVLLMHGVVRVLARRSVWAEALLRRARVPFRPTVLATTLVAVVANARPEEITEEWWEPSPWWRGCSRSAQVPGCSRPH